MWCLAGVLVMYFPTIALLCFVTSAGGCGNLIHHGLLIHKQLFLTLWKKECLKWRGADGMFHGQSSNSTCCSERFLISNVEYAQGTRTINWSGEILIPTAQNALKRATETSSPFLLHCLLPSIAPGLVSQHRKDGDLLEQVQMRPQHIRGMEHLSHEAELRELGFFSLGKSRLPLKRLYSSLPVPKG